MKKTTLFAMLLSVSLCSFAFEAPVVDLSQNLDDTQQQAQPQAQQPAPAQTAPAREEATTYPMQTTAAEPAPAQPQNQPHTTIPAVSREGLSKDQRITLLEQQMDNLIQMNLLNRTEDLQMQAQKLTGDSEQHDHDIKALNDKLRDFYKDLEQRLNRSNASQEPKENNGSTLDSAGTTLPSAPNATALPDNQQSIPKEQKAYEDAFNLLQQKKYPAASWKLREYLNAYPNGTYAVNAHYWLGESYYLSNKFTEAAGQFKIIADKYPNSTKAPDAMLKLGIIYSAQGKSDLSKMQLQKLMKRFPNSNAAKLAAQQM